MSRYIVAIALALFLASACNSPQKPPALFKLLRKDATHLDFENVLRQSTAFNVFNYMYFFNGGGVGAGDFNNDGLVDLYFTSNMGPNKMFLNEGNLKFRDVTEPAGVAGIDGWTSGISVVDINNDGLLDLYVGQLGDYQGITGKNQLFVCQGIRDGIPVYVDQAAAWGLDLSGFSTQAVFFDYDLDGDLDLFQLNHTLHQNGTFGPRKNFEGKIHPLAGDKLLRNDGPPQPPRRGGEAARPHTGGGFTDVTRQAGIHSTVIGYGLGVVAGDVNNDGWPDLYIGNDFHENDYLYLNRGDGTFRDVMAETMMHTSQFSMGVDMADVNNDGWEDIISLDMLPEDPYILKTSLGEDAYNVFQYKVGLGYYYQYTRNNLQLNNGAWAPQPPPVGGRGASPRASEPYAHSRGSGKAGRGNASSTAPAPHSNTGTATPLPPVGGAGGGFAEIGLFAGIAATDWSWAPLFMDFDHDGYKDLFVSNGIPRRMNDIDYVKFQENRELQLQEGTTRDVKESELAVVDQMPKVKLPNKFFRNTGRLTFDDLGEQVAGALPTFSNGAIYADLDNDGDLDVVVNNIEDEPFIYQNLLHENNAATPPFLSFTFNGQPGNRHGIGTKVLIFKKNGEHQIETFYPVRGYQSSAHIPLHIGIGDPAAVDSVVVVWPDRTHARVTDLKFGTTQTLTWQPGLPEFDYGVLRKASPPFDFADITAAAGLDFKHIENGFVEFNRETLLPNMVSTEGPALAVGDVNGDGREDVFFGSSKRERSVLFVQEKNGKFTRKTSPDIERDSIFEDVDAVFADLENDGDLDLVIAAGGNEYRGQEEPMQQRAYLNDGKGNFTRANPFPGLFMTASCVLSGDFNGDGLTDFFFGGRAIPWKYGLTPNSYLMQNMGNGRFEDVTQQAAPGLQEAGLVKNAAWTDLDADGDPDLLLAMEWEPLTVFLNTAGKLEKKTLGTGKGWWNVVLPCDFDGDGDVDILAGNTGKNSRLKPTAQEPVRLYAGDFDQNGQTETVLTYYLKGREIPFANHEEMMKALPVLKKKYLRSKDFAQATIGDLFGKEALSKAVLREADTFESRYFENTGNLNFRAHPLPDALQFSTLNAAALHDLDGDGRPEVVVGGNFYDCNIEMGRYDASFGNVLSIGPGGDLKVYPLGNIRVKDQVRRIEPLRVSGKMCLVFARNNATCVLLQPVQSLYGETPVSPVR